MARKLRIERSGTLYHVINRGNYREDIFATTGARQASAKTPDLKMHDPVWRSPFGFNLASFPFGFLDPIWLPAKTSTVKMK